MHPCVREVPGTKEPVGIAALTVLLRWPDRGLFSKFMNGFEIVGHIESSGVFRPKAQERIEDKQVEKEFLGDNAVKFISDLHFNGDMEDARELEKLVDKQLERRRFKNPTNLTGMNKRWGEGRWRPIPYSVSFSHRGRCA